MTDKKNNIKLMLQVLIDNIDEFGSKFVTYKTDSMKDLLENTLEYIKNKEQECEELHARTASIIYSLTGGRLSYSTYTLEGCEQAYYDQLEIDVERATKELQEELQAKEQECKNLEEEIRGCRIGIKDISIENTEICKISEKYKQALDKIEKLIPKFDTSTECDYGDFDCENCSSLDEEIVCGYKLKKIIKGIINKVKEK